MDLFCTKRVLLAVVVIFTIQDFRTAVSQEVSGPVFETDIMPLLEARCIRCHGGEKQEAGLDLRRRFLMQKGGDSGTALLAGNPDESLLIQKVEANEMPPAEEGPLDASQKSLLRKWVAGGAALLAKEEMPLDESEQSSRITEADRSFWSFQSPQRPPVPEVTSADFAVKNPVDAFLLARMQEKGLSFNPEAPKEVLLRRMTFDLIGLPPTTEELDSFLADDSADAVEKLADRLLASPRYGERWARHWLDVAGYADSDGYLAADRLRPEAWRYRDWVIRSLNNDLPYDQFVIQQLAGDELSQWRKMDEITPEVADQLTATGFLRTASDPTYPGYTEPNEIHQVMADTLQIVGSSFLGLTIQCARCHQHKLDPISQRDYYSLLACFQGALDPDRWQPSEVRGIRLASEAEDARITQHNASVDERVKSLNESLVNLTGRYRQKRIAEAWATFATNSEAAGSGAARPAAVSEIVVPEGETLSDSVAAELKAALSVESAKRTEEQKKLVASMAPSVNVEEAGLSERYAEYAAESAKFKAAIAAESALRVSVPLIRGMVDIDEKAAVSKILRRGDHQKPGAEVSANIPEVLETPGIEFKPQPDYKTTGRRLALARWLTDPKHPLLARVHVNRIWAAHFGRGLVPTLSNFGHSGARPSHPELLDWLACEFMEPTTDSTAPTDSATGAASGAGAQEKHSRKWSQKALHRLLVTSMAYRQSSDTDAVRQAQDPDNVLLSAWQPRRHQGEVVRDSLLAVSGRLNSTAFGTPAGVRPQGDGSVIETDATDGQRRSIYQIVRRSQHLTLLELFDTPVMEINCPERPVSTVPLQALAMLHGPAAEQAAGSLASLVMTASQDNGQRIRFVWRRLYAREPQLSEISVVEQTLAELTAEKSSSDPGQTNEADSAAVNAAWREVCLVLLNSNEFIYVH